MTLLLILTKGFNIGVSVYSFEDYEDKNIIDGFAGEYSILIINFFVSILLIITNFIFTVDKKNKLKYKKAVCLGICILLLFIPIVKYGYSGGIAGISEINTYSAVTFLLDRFAH